jgi:putative transposase
VRAYTTDLTDEQWNQIEDFIPKPKFGGRPRKTDVRRCVDGILYLVRTGCQWRQLPHDFPPWETVYRYFTDWRKCGAVRKIQRYLYEMSSFINRGNPEGPSILVVDSQSVKTAKAGGARGYDGGKRVKGRKRHLLVDSQGLMVDVSVTTANVHDTKGGIKVLTKAHKWMSKAFVGKVKTVYADKGYQGPGFSSWVKGKMGAVAEISGSLAKLARKFVPVKKRWVVERSFAWFSDYRRLDKDHERKIVSSIVMMRWAMIRLMLVRLC